MNDAAPEPIPYATPMLYSGPQGVWRERDLLVIAKNSPIPPQCVKCNQPPAANWRWRKTLYWHTPGLYILVLFPGVLIYVIVAMIVRKSARVEIGLCDLHLGRRRRDIAIAWLLVLVAFVLLFVAVSTGSDRAYSRGPIPLIAGIGGFVLIIGSLIWAIVRTRPVVPKKIDDNFAWLSGAGADYLNTLPPTGR